MADEGRETVDGSRAFHLRPDAPLDLVTEVYWHLAFDLQKEAGDDLEAARRLDQLNRAYAMVVHVNESATNGPRPAPSLLRPPPAPPRRSLFSRGGQKANGDAPHATPWELLCVERDAPQGVIALAYGYWAKRLRNSGPGPGPTGLERLDASYAALTALPAEAGAAQDAATREADLPPLLEELADPPATPPRDAAAAGAEATPSGQRRARPAKRPGRLAVAVRSRARRTYRRFAAVVKKRLVDPFGEFERYAREGPPGKPGEREEAQVALDVSSRFAGLAGVSAAGDVGIAHNAPQPGVTRPKPTTEPPPAGASAALVAVSGRRSEPVIPLRQDGLTIGATEGCDLLLRPSGNGDQGVTARIWERGGRYLLHVLTDGSTVFVNDEPAAWALLEPGDRVRIGDEVFVFQQEAQR